MGAFGYLALILTLATLLALVRAYSVFSTRTTAKPSGRRDPSETCGLAVFLGSGGHTSEALGLLSALDFARYFPRTYIFSEGDTLSVQKAIDLEAAKAAELPQDVPHSLRSSPPYTFVTIPRARRVHQPLLTTPLSAAYSLAVSVWHITLAPILSGSKLPDVLLLNGPGTCFVLCIAVYINRILGLKSPKLIYVESFARVQRLSLSGKLLRPLVDRFVVQWPDLLRDGKRGECRGWLV